MARQTTADAIWFHFAAGYGYGLGFGFVPATNRSLKSILTLAMPTARPGDCTAMWHAACGIYWQAQQIRFQRCFHFGSCG